MLNLNLNYVITNSTPAEELDKIISELCGFTDMIKAIRRSLPSDIAPVPEEEEVVSVDSDLVVTETIITEVKGTEKVRRGKPRKNPRNQTVMKYSADGKEEYLLEYNKNGLATHRIFPSGRLQRFDLNKGDWVDCTRLYKDRGYF